MEGAILQEGGIRMDGIVMSLSSKLVQLEIQKIGVCIETPPSGV